MTQGLGRFQYLAQGSRGSIQGSSKFSQGSGLTFNTPITKIANHSSIALGRAGGAGRIDILRIEGAVAKANPASCISRPAPKSC